MALIVRPFIRTGHFATACPGDRAPHFWLGKARPLFDEFGPDWTLLRLGTGVPTGDSFVAAAMTAGFGLKVVHLASDDARDLYEAPLALIRPDQIVAWRGQTDTDAQTILTAALGGHPA